MALRIHSLDQMASHAPRVPAPTQGKAAGATVSTASQASAQTSSTEAPSFSAVFAQIAAAAAGAGTTVASIAPEASGASQPASVTPAATASPSVTTPAATSTAPASAVSPSTATASTAPATTADDDDGPAGPLFGPNPWLSDPTGEGPNGTVTHYNPVYFATQQTAQTVAQMLGGTVVQSVQITTAPGSPFQQDEANYMVQLPGGGMVNPGFIADLYSHGWNQGFINQQIDAEVAGAQAAVNS